MSNCNSVLRFMTACCAEDVLISSLRDAFNSLAECLLYGGFARVILLHQTCRLCPRLSLPFCRVFHQSPTTLTGDVCAEQLNAGPWDTRCACSSISAGAFNMPCYAHLFSFGSTLANGRAHSSICRAGLKCSRTMNSAPNDVGSVQALFRRISYLIIFNPVGASGMILTRAHLQVQRLLITTSVLLGESNQHLPRHRLWPWRGRLL